jgi:hypothetical protein
LPTSRSRPHHARRRSKADKYGPLAEALNARSAAGTLNASSAKGKRSLAVWSSIRSRDERTRLPSATSSPPRWRSSPLPRLSAGRGSRGRSSHSSTSRARSICCLRFPLPLFTARRRTWGPILDTGFLGAGTSRDALRDLCSSWEALERADVRVAMAARARSTSR